MGTRKVDANFFIETLWINTDAARSEEPLTLAEIRILLLLDSEGAYPGRPRTITLSEMAKRLHYGSANSVRKPLDALKRRGLLDETIGRGLAHEFTLTLVEAHPLRRRGTTRRLKIHQKPTPRPHTQKSE